MNIVVTLFVTTFVWMDELRLNSNYRAFAEALAHGGELKL